MKDLKNVYLNFDSNLLSDFKKQIKDSVYAHKYFFFKTQLIIF